MRFTKLDPALQRMWFQLMEPRLDTKRIAKQAIFYAKQLEMIV